VIEEYNSITSRVIDTHSQLSNDHVHYQ
jgi:hypothetical protein